MTNTKAICFLLGLSIMIFFWAVGCEKNNSAESPEFTEGTYKGIYTVVRNHGTATEVTKVDSMFFEFVDESPLNRLFMVLDTDRDNDRKFCDWSCDWEWTAFDTISMTTTHDGGMVCDPDDQPSAVFSFKTTSSGFVMNSYDPSIWRRIDLEFR